MPAGIVAAERTPVQPHAVSNPWSPGDGYVSVAKLHSVLKELEAAKTLVNRLAHSAYDKLDGEEMYDLGAAEGMLAGAITKITAAGGPS